jgi:hypothetical protein
MTFAPAGAGFSAAVWTNGAFSLPGKTVRGAATTCEVAFFFVAM